MAIITFEEAYEIVMNSAFTTGSEIIPFTDSLNRVIAADIFSDMDMPPFNKATVDGFACKRANLESDLEMIETIPAGTAPGKVVMENQCSKIMTGAPVPDGADMVFMVEDSLILPSGKVRYSGAFTKDNISFRGEDIRNSDIVLKKGKLINPQDIALMALAGNTSVIVSKLPLIAVISSGDELVEPSENPSPAQIRNTNAYQLMAQIKRAGAHGIYYGIARDDEEATSRIIEEAILKSDIVLITGGVSMGDFDFIPSVLKNAGVNILFSRVNIQPGKPTTFGLHPKALLFGLPGNPVSSFIQFELMVRPLLYKMMGYDWEPFTFDLPMEVEYSRRSSDRRAIIPVIITREGRVSPVEYHGSAHISALSLASGVISLPVGKEKFSKGEIVSVRQV